MSHDLRFRIGWFMGRVVIIRKFSVLVLFVG